MIDLGKKNILGTQIDAVDYEAAVARIMAAARGRQPMAVAALAVHGVMTAVFDATYRYRLNKLDLVVPDGQPVRWALNAIHRARLTDRVYGPELTLRVCENAAATGLPVFLYGSRPEVIARLGQNLKARFPAVIIAGAMPSKFRQLSPEECLETIGDIRDSNAALVLVGLGAPRQEVWAFENRDALSMPVLAVGAAFDFIAETVPQAPPRLQKAGLEWLFRFVHEPVRLWRRYLLLNPAYVVLIVLQLMHLVRFDPMHATPPVRPLRYG